MRRDDVTTELETAADGLTAAIGGRDASILSKLYADDIVVWHAATQQEQNKTENIGMLSAVFEVTSRLEYIDIRRHVSGDVVVQQHSLVGEFDDGKPLPKIPACLVMRVRGGKIVRIEEYFDSSTFAEVWERLASLTPA